MESFEKPDGMQPPASTVDDRGRAVSMQASLAALKALLSVEGVESCARALTALGRVFAFDHAMVLDVREGEAQCIAAIPAELVGRHWTDGTFVQRIMLGGVIPVPAARAAEDWPDLPP